MLIRLPDDPSLGRELRTYLQTESYVKTKHTGSLPDTTKRILRDRSEDNRTRRARIVEKPQVDAGDGELFRQRPEARHQPQRSEGRPG